MSLVEGLCVSLKDFVPLGDGHELMVDGVTYTVSTRLLRSLRAQADKDACTIVTTMRKLRDEIHSLTHQHN